MTTVGDGFRWLEPWHGSPGTAGVPGLEQELAREVGAGHSLYHFKTEAVARRFDQDDVLFRVLGVDGDTVAYAEVHLTWPGTRETLPEFPHTVWFATLDLWAERRMRPDHDEWMRTISDADAS